MKKWFAFVTAWLPVAVFAEVAVIPSTLSTGTFANYDDAPATPDADDPAIWVHRERPSESLVIGTLKDAGLVVYDLKGRVVQKIAPPNLSTVLPQDPPSPVGVNTASPEPCADSESGETFGRFNNIEVAYDVKLGGKRRDVAVVTDRGCDHLRVYAIDPDHPHGPLIDITSDHAPRVYPWRVVQPSPLQPAELTSVAKVTPFASESKASQTTFGYRISGVQDNPLDDQDTGYGLGLWNDGGELYAFVSQRNRSVVMQLRLFADSTGRVSYKPVRGFLFNPNFRLKSINWTPCRENANEDPQSEGIVVDAERGVLYVAFETIGIYRISLKQRLPSVVQVGRESLFEPAKSFGQAYWAIPNDDEFECQYAPSGDAEEGTIVASGDASFAGKNLQVDVEGLAIYRTGKHKGYLIASSQGDDTFHIYDRNNPTRHLGTFTVQGTGESDGIAIADVPVGRKFAGGLVVVQNGKAADPTDTSDINGYEYDGSTQFRYVDWLNLADTLGLDSVER
jgi:3-phytase